jgi:hypothetical protein
MCDLHLACAVAHHLDLLDALAERSRQMRRHPHTGLGYHARIDLDNGVAGGLVEPKRAFGADPEPDPRPIPKLGRRLLNQPGGIDLDPERVRQLSRNDLALEPHLRLILDMLPVAPAAARQIRTRRHPPLSTRTHDFTNLRDAVVAPLRNNLDVKVIPDHGARHHHRLSANPPNPKHAKRHRADFNLRHRVKLIPTTQFARRDL